MTQDWTYPFLSSIAVRVILVAICLDVLWETAWKGIALWRAGRNGHKGWFIAILILNTIGILPIVYVFCFSKRGQSNEKS